MNSPVTFPPVRPILKLTRASAATASAEEKEKWAATLAEERRRLVEDQEALREREANLRDYESRLRALQAELETGQPAAATPARTTAAPFVRPSSRSPFESDEALQAAWEKLHRTHALLEAEQAQMCDERLALRDRLADVKRREETLAAREARVTEREQLVAAAVATAPSAEPIAGEHTMSAMSRLTTAPFAMARSVFGGKK